MGKKIKIIVFLLLLAPLMGEVLSLSTTILEFINPIYFLVLVFLYGGGAVIVREIRVKWQMQWSVVFLTIAYGIIEEGIMIQSFFNVSHADLGALSGYGVFGGMMWPWAIMLTFFHATMSTLFPIVMADFLWPDYRNTRLLGKKGLAAVFFGFIFVIIFWLFAMVLGKNDYYQDYKMNILLVLAALAAAIILVWLGYFFRNSRFSQKIRKIFPVFVFGVAGFLFQAVNIILPGVMAQNKASALVAIFFQIILVVAVLLFAVFQLLAGAGKKRIVYFVFGSVLFYILIMLAQGIGNIAYFFPALVFLLGLFFWGRIALKNNFQEKNATNR